MTLSNAARQQRYRRKLRKAAEIIDRIEQRLRENDDDFDLNGDMLTVTFIDDLIRQYRRGEA